MRMNKESFMTDSRYDKEEEAKKNVKEYFMTGRISSEVTAYILRLLGFSALRGKEIVKQWASEET